MSNLKYFCDCKQDGRFNRLVEQGRGTMKETKANNDYCIYCGHIAMAEREKREKQNTKKTFFEDPIDLIRY